MNLVGQKRRPDFSHMYATNEWTIFPYILFVNTSNTCLDDCTKKVLLFVFSDQNTDSKLDFISKGKIKSISL